MRAKGGPDGFSGDAVIAKEPRHGDARDQCVRRTELSSLGSHRFSLPLDANRLREKSQFRLTHYTACHFGARPIWSYSVNNVPRSLSLPQRVRKQQTLGYSESTLPSMSAGWNQTERIEEGES